MEYENNKKLPFLDTCVIRSAIKYITSIYHKPTFTGVYLNWTSLTSRKYKLGLIRCLMDRIWKICSEETDRLIEIKMLKNILTKNEYPSEIVAKEIERFIKKKQDTISEAIGPKIVSEGNLNKNKTRFIVLLYVSKKAERFEYRFKKLVKENFPQVEFNVAFKAPNTIDSMYPFNDKIENILDR